MDKILRPAILGAAFLLIAGCAFAGESVTVEVTCTIPAIPGVNAPMVEQTASSADPRIAYAATNGEINTQQSGEAGSGSEIKDEGQKIEETSESPLVLVKTIYSK